MLTQDEVALLLEQILSQYELLMGMLYGAGLRRMELVRLCVNDIDTSMKQIRVWNGKGFKHRFTTLAVELLSVIEQQTKRV